jgi:hypothetical protein
VEEGEAVGFARSLCNTFASLGGGLLAARFSMVFIEIKVLYI